MDKIIAYSMVFAMTVLGSVASLFLKKASGAKTIAALVKNINLYLGGGLYLLAAALNIAALKTLNYSTVLPLTAIGYIWTMILARAVLKEKITVRKIIGVAAIIGGAVLIVQ